jgi:hypothetical protein
VIPATSGVLTIGGSGKASLFLIHCSLLILRNHMEVQHLHKIHHIPK